MTPPAQGLLARLTARFPQEWPITACIAWGFGVGIVGLGGSA
jgi:hypothetical protein